MISIGEDYVIASRGPHKGEIFYNTGELYYKGECVTLSTGQVCPCGHGIQYYKDGRVKQEGLFQRRGLVCGRMYYPSGRLKFEGYCRETSGYGTAYPTIGTFYSEDGCVLYRGNFHVKCGGVGCPIVVIPEGFGPLI